MNKEHENIIRTLTGKASPQEVEEMQQWIAESEENLHEYQSLKAIWELSGKPDPPPPPVESLIMWQKIDQRIKAGDSRKVEEVFDFSWILKIAAVLLLAVSGVLLYNHMREVNSNQPQYQTAYSKAAEEVKNTLETQSGQKLTYALSDGSIVYLNTESKITYSRNFAEDKREIELTGEAFFSVQPDKTRPFIVKSGNSQVTVTGTEFNIRNRNNHIKIVVAKGSVNVLSLNLNKAENMKAGEMVEIGKSGSISQPSNANMKYALAWRENKLAFNHTSLKEVMTEIERTFNVKAEFLNYSSRARTITGIFETDSLDKILKVISITLDINISQKGMKIIIQ